MTVSPDVKTPGSGHAWGRGRIYANLSQTIGNTPLVRLARIGRAAHAKAEILMKLEFLNPLSSIKDRISVAMIDALEAEGRLVPGKSVLVEATSGSAGISLAFVAAARGYRLILTMPERMSSERVALLKYLGVQVILTPGSLMRDAVVRADALEKEIPGAIQLRQFDNPANPEVHRKTTAREIWDDTDGAVDVFVAGVGTGGTITGVGEVLKRLKPEVRIIAVEPENAAVLSGGRPRHHLIQGIGAGFIPSILNRDVIDEVIPVSDTAAIEQARRLAREEGILAGISSGATLAASLAVASRPEMLGKLVVTMVCDTGERYVNTPLMGELVADHSPR
jgi:cysteine synthase A